jgi:AraC-like DNA-binding protein
MAASAPDQQRSSFSYSCYVTRNREGEQFVPEHVFSYQVSGTLTVNNGSKEYVFKEGDFRFIKRNQLIKFIKQPAPGGVFEAVSVYFDQDLLKQFSLEYGYNAAQTGKEKTDAVMELTKEPLYKSFMDSLLPYLQGNALINEQLQALKLREALLILLQSKPSLGQLLFDFQEPGKIDLEEFMNRNFHFNVQLKRFAYLTGRSLATFKRDFEQIFHLSPSKWLLQRRLQEAHYLIREKGKAPADVYLETGFEDLSHFSYAFKKMYGMPPSRVAG